MNVPSVDLASTGSNFDVATFDGVVAQPAHRLAATARANNSLLMLFSLFRRLVCLSPSIARHFSLLCPNVTVLTEARFGADSQEPIVGILHIFE